MKKINELIDKINENRWIKFLTGVLGVSLIGVIVYFFDKIKNITITMTYELKLTIALSILFLLLFNILLSLRKIIKSQLEVKRKSEVLQLGLNIVLNESKEKYLSVIDDYMNRGYITKDEKLELSSTVIRPNT